MDNNNSSGRSAILLLALENLLEVDRVGLLYWEDDGTCISGRHRRFI